MTSSTAGTRPVSGRARYELLDVFRGIAALSVVAYHCINGLIDQGRSVVADVLWNGWSGVYVFFPISGFCILAASHSRANARVGDFLRRRWKRIFPTYWASIAFVIAVTIVFAPLSHGSPRDLLAPGAGWLSILTLTQTFIGLPQAINPVYWSLCYEEQFYVLIALTMVAREDARRWLLLAISLFAAMAKAFGPQSVLPQGLFVDYWLNFAVGLAVFGWSDPRYGRLWSFVLVALSGGVAAATRSTDLTISVGAAALLIALRPFDGRISSARLLAPLGGIGIFSYSLYLTHVPIAGRIVNLARRMGPEATAWWPVVLTIGTAAAIFVAWLFYHFVERRFLNSRTAPATVIRVPAAAAAMAVEV